jgi:hypothetical protein
MRSIIKLIGNLVSILFEISGWLQLLSNPVKYLIRRVLFSGNTSIMKWFS